SHGTEASSVRSQPVDENSTGRRSTEPAADTRLPRTVPSNSSEISACKYLLVADFTSDPYGIARELRAQARARGFEVVTAPSGIPRTEFSKACFMAGSWSAGGFSERLSLRVNDVAGVLIAEASAGATNWRGV